MSTEVDHLEPDDHRLLTAAQGYLELGLFLDANEELDQIDPYVQCVPEVLELRLAIYGTLMKWDLMETVARKLAQFDPENVQWAISWACATRRADCLEAARTILVNALEIHAGEAAIHYNLGCYECQLGNLEATKRRLEQAFSLNPMLRKSALADLDLEPFWRLYSSPLEDHLS